MQTRKPTRVIVMEQTQVVARERARVMAKGKSGEGVGGLLTCCSRWQVLSIEKTKCNRSKGSLKSTSSNRNNGVSNIMEKMPKWVDLYNRTGCHGLRIRQRSHGHTWQGLER